MKEGQEDADTYPDVYLMEDTVQMATGGTLIHSNALICKFPHDASWHFWANFSLQLNWHGCFKEWVLPLQVLGTYSGLGIQINNIFCNIFLINLELFLTFFLLSNYLFQMWQVCFLPEGELTNYSCFRETTTNSTSQLAYSSPEDAGNHLTTPFPETVPVWALHHLGLLSPPSNLVVGHQPLTLPQLILDTAVRNTFLKEYLFYHPGFHLKSLHCFSIDYKLTQFLSKT